MQLCMVGRGKNSGEQFITDKKVSDSVEGKAMSLSTSHMIPEHISNQPGKNDFKSTMSIPTQNLS